MEIECKIVETLKTRLKDSLIEAKIPRERRIFVNVKKESLADAVGHLVTDLKFKHLSTITGVDLDEEIEVIYHMAYKDSIELSLKLSVSKDEPTIPTITDLIPGAVLYEREINDLLGVNFTGHPDLSPLMLPEEWPHGIHPLRKEYKVEQLKAIAHDRNTTEDRD